MRTLMQPPDDLLVLGCGARGWPWPDTIDSACDLMLARYGAALRMIEGDADGADTAFHNWCVRRGWGPERHMCCPVDWAAVRASEEFTAAANDKQRRAVLARAGRGRNTTMLRERPGLITAFHNWFRPDSGGTCDMVVKGLLAGVPVWLVRRQNPQKGVWMHLADFPAWRVRQARDELETAGLLV